MEKLAKRLLLSKVSETTDFDNMKIRTIQATYACDNCIFDSPEKANGCEFEDDCMAHLRKDRESVVFTYVAAN